MIINTKSLEIFNKTYLQKERISYRRKLKMFDSFYNFAKSLGVLKKIDPWEGIDRDIKIAHLLNKLR